MDTDQVAVREAELADMLSKSCGDREKIEDAMATLAALRKKGVRRPTYRLESGHVQHSYRHIKADK